MTGLPNVKFDNTFNWGHIASAITMIVAAVTVVWNLHTTSVKDDLAVVALQESQKETLLAVGELKGKFSTLDVTLKLMNERFENFATNSQATRNQVADLSEAVGSMKESLADARARNGLPYREIK